MNVILQPIHLLLYMSLIGAANDLVARNPIYALVAIGFLIPAEKFIKNMFGLNKASSTSDFSSFAKNALAYEGLKKLGSAVSGGVGKSTKAIKGSSSSEQDSDKNTFNKIRRAELGSYAANTGDSDEIEDNDRPTLIGDNAQDENKNEDINNEGKIDNEPINQSEWIKQQKQKDLDKGFYLPDSYYQRGAEQWNKEQQERALQERQEKERLAQEGAKIQQVEKQNIPNNAPQIRPGYRKRIAGRVGRATAKGLLKGAKIGTKVATKTFGTLGGATIGLASAIGTGDVSNVAKYTIAGAMAGNQIGNATIGLAGKTKEAVVNGTQAVKNIYGSAMDVINEEKFGTSVAKEERDKRINSEARKQFLKDEKQIKKYKEMARDIGYNGGVEQLMNAAADYKEAGVSDDMIKNALKVEQKRDNTIGGNSHSKMIDVASFATENGYKKSDILANKSRSDMEDVVQTTVAKKDRYEVMKNIADLYGAGDFYSKNSRFKKPSVDNKVITSGKSSSNKNTNKK